MKFFAPPKPACFFAASEARGEAVEAEQVGEGQAEQPRPADAQQFAAADAVTGRSGFVRGWKA